MTYDPFTGQPVPQRPPSPVKAAAPSDKSVVITPTFLQELLALLLQLFGSSVGARDQVHLMSKLKEMHGSLHGDAAEGEEPSERASQRHPMTDEEWEKYQASKQDQPKLEERTGWLR